MDAKPATSLSTRLLVLLCLAVAATGLVWQSWDMFSSRQRSILQMGDDLYYYVWLPSVVIDHDLDFSNQLAQRTEFPEEIQNPGFEGNRTPVGLIPNKYPPGWALGSLPFFLMAHVISPAGSSGFEPLYLIAVWLGQIVYALIGFWLAGKILARFFPLDVARVAVLVGWLASPLIYYQSVRLSMSHSQVFALGMTVFWLSLKLADGEGRTLQWLLLGFCSALLVVTRNVTLVYLLLPAFVVVRKMRSFQAALSFAVGAVVPLAVQLVAWKILFGSWLVYSYGGENFEFAQFRFLEVLFSPRHGWFYWHPLLLPGIAAFITWSVRRSVGWAWLVSLLAIFFLNASWRMWWLGSSFGQRGFDLANFFAMVGLAVLLQSAQTRPGMRFVLKAAMVLAIAFNLVLFILFLTRRISRDEAVTYGDVARALIDWAKAVR